MNPLLDTRVYNVKFADGDYEEFSANMIYQNLYDQVDDYGQSYQLFKGIIDYRRDENAVSKDDGFFINSSGIKQKVITTSGWWFLTEWEDGTADWVSLKLIKESNPIETAEFVKAHGLDKEPAFSWWVNKVLKKKNSLSSKSDIEFLRSS